MKSYIITVFIAFNFLAFLSCFEVNAQIDKTPKNTSRKKVKNYQWEYCVISLSGTVTTASNQVIGQAFIVYLEETNKPEDKIVITDFPSNAALAKQKALSKAFAQLGNDGWELVGSFPFVHEQNGEGGLSFYFKRRKPSL